MRITVRIGVAAAVMTVLGVLPLVAQEKKPDSTPAETKRTNDPSRRVPVYFGQIGLTPEQRESIYKVRAKQFFLFA